MNCQDGNYERWKAVKGHSLDTHLVGDQDFVIYFDGQVVCLNNEGIFGVEMGRKTHLFRC